MNKFGKNKKQFYLILIFCGIIFIVFVYLLFAGPKKASPSTSNDIETYYTEKEPVSGEAVSGLIDKTPYTGTNFSFTYDYDDAFFYVYINPANEAAGNAEFDTFLKRNGVDNRSLILGLRTSSLPLPTPEP